MHRCGNIRLSKKKPAAKFVLQDLPLHTFHYSVHTYRVSRSSWLYIPCLRTWLNAEAFYCLSVKD